MIEWDDYENLTWCFCLPIPSWIHALWHVKLVVRLRVFLKPTELLYLWFEHMIIMKKWRTWVSLALQGQKKGRGKKLSTLATQANLSMTRENDLPYNVQRHTPVYSPRATPTLSLFQKWSVCQTLASYTCTCFSCSEKRLFSNAIFSNKYGTTRSRAK